MTAKDDAEMMTMFQSARNVIARRETFILAALWLAFSIYYLILLTDGHFDILRPIGLGLTFNNMLEHLLRGNSMSTRR